MTYKVPDETTIARTLEVVDSKSLFLAWDMFISIMYNDTARDQVASFDGKSIRAIHGRTIGGHIISLFTHHLHQTIAQIEVADKSNEIPAARRMLKKTYIAGMTILADALHTQTDTLDIIRQKQAHYFLFVKGNQEELMTDIAFTLTDQEIVKEYATYSDGASTRHVVVTVEITKDTTVMDYFTSKWKDVTTIGKIRRTGIRTDRNIVTPIDETIYFISSRALSAQDAVDIVHGHWSIENNLHWQKDYTYLAG